MSRPLVSIILPTYNRAELLPRTLESILSQTHSDWEAIVVDDGSTDDTSEVIRSFAPRFAGTLIYIQQVNGGSSSARNSGIDAASGDFVAFLDSDDEFLPKKLERQLELFARCPELGLVYCDYSFVDLSGRRFASAFTEKMPAARRVPGTLVAPNLFRCETDFFDHLLRDYFVATISGMVRREVLGTSIRFSTRLSYAEEWLFYLRVARMTAAGFVDEPLCVHHFTPGSLARLDTHRNSRQLLSLLYEVESLFPSLTHIQRRILNINLAKASRQLGYDDFRTGKYAEAVRRFGQSFRHGPQVSTLVDYLHALLRSFRTRLTPNH